MSTNKLLVFLLIFGFQLVKSQQYTISGKIYEAESKEPLPFVPVIIKGTNVGTQSDFDGNFVIKTDKLGDSLIASYVGYKKLARPINKSLKVQEINMPMANGGISLEEVVVVMGENPAHRIIRNAVRVKEKNNRANLESYEYETYNKLEFDLTRIPKEMREKKILKPIQFVFENVDSTNSGERPSLPFFMIESISQLYYKSNPVRKKEVIKASKITGVENASISQVLGDMYQNINIYNNNVIAFNKQIPSPIGENALFYYKFYLEDSLFQDNHYVYH
ncbi:MAG: carboxypeptidase-like regulatory domain-containing protein, partial [Bacteroidia bacterium]|nr:carboxypeptidase-like regulatory domain-containing protein [Bacteroidia bacterium]